MPKFKTHYTGIEIAHINFPKGDLYMQRDLRTKKPKFARLSIGKKMIGIFIGKCNYLRGYGIELFTNKLHFGFARNKFGWDYDTKYGLMEVQYSGSMNEPYTSVTVRLGIIYYGQRTPEWLKKLKEKERDEILGDPKDDPCYGCLAGACGDCCANCSVLNGE